MKKSFIVIGLGRFGLSVVNQLAKQTNQLIAVDVDEKRVDLIKGEVEQCFCCDCTNKNVLEELNVSKIDHAIVAIGNNLEATILTTMNLKELGVKKVTVRIDETKYENLLKRVGADVVIVPEEDAGIELAKKVVSDSILDYYQVDKEYGVVQISIPNNFKEQSLIELNARNKFDVNIVGVIRNKSFFIPKGQDKVQPNDVIMVVGKSNKIIKFDNYVNK